MGFSRQEYWSGWPFASPGDLPDPGIEPESPALAGDFFPLLFFYFLINVFILIGGQLLYNIVVVFAIH